MFYKIYSVIIWAIVCLIILGIIQNKKYTSNKMKFWYLLSFSFLLLSFIMRIYMFLGVNLQYLYLFKHIYYLNYLATFMGIFISMFVLLRSDTLKFDYIKLMIIFSSIIFMVITCTSPIQIKLNAQLGYIMIIENPIYINLFKGVIGLMIIVSSLYILKNKCNNKMGILLIVFYAFMQLLSIFIKSNIYELMSIVEMATQLLGIVIMNYSILKFKRKKA